jgi:hypothetical protein
MLVKHPVELNAITAFQQEVECKDGVMIASIIFTIVLVWLKNINNFVLLADGAILTYQPLTISRSIFTGSEFCRSANQRQFISVLSVDSGKLIPGPGLRFC